MTARLVAITGPTSGIGRAAALALARHGDRLVLLARDLARAGLLADELRAAGAPEVQVVGCDLASLASVRAAADAVLAANPRLDVLVNNAGGIWSTRKTTADGHELTWATNHLGPFLLTELLVPRLIASAPARVVTVASRAHERGRIYWEDPDLARGWTSWRAYCQSKLANVMSTAELARRIDGTGVVAHSLHPGVIASGFGQNDGGIMSILMRLARPFLSSNEDGARTTVHLATADVALRTTGGYWADSRPATPSRRARAVDDQDRLTALTRRQVGLPG